MYHTERSEDVLALSLPLLLVPHLIHKRGIILAQIMSYWITNKLQLVIHEVNKSSKKPLQTNDDKKRKISVNFENWISLIYLRYGPVST